MHRPTLRPLGSDAVQASTAVSCPAVVSYPGESDYRLLGIGGSG